jgi:UDPglucose 6-dehydrogenase
MGGSRVQAASQGRSMKIGFVGIGSLGLPCAVAIAMNGHDVMAYDVAPDLMTKRPRGYHETGPDGEKPFSPYLEQSDLRFGDLEEVVAHAQILFVAVQTPHQPGYEGVTRLPSDRKDFDYCHLIRSIEEISAAARRETIVAVVSTVLPGTMRRCVMPAASPLLRLCYNPSFVAMGTTMRDFLHPEFVLLGADDPISAKALEAFYASITDAPIYGMSIESAEITKLAYNTYIGMKIVFANTVMEICHKMPGANVDDVTGALKTANQRLVSPRYLDGGLGDGGGCHPRDNIAMSWLARQLPLSHDFFGDLMTARDHQTEWLADLMCAYDLPKAIVGYSYKSGTNRIAGSPALLLKNILEERGYRPLVYDPHVEGTRRDLLKLAPHVVLIGAKHPEFTSLRFAKGSIVMDPWRYLAPQDGVTLVHVGVGKRP